MTKIPFTYRYATIALVLVLMLTSGCSKNVTRVDPLDQDIPGYLQLRDQFGPRDFRPLLGRKVVLDPGHGGFFKGAVGPNGLTEAEVNLGVAHYLRGLLEWAGAEVYLTRSADYDFLSPQDSTLAGDLAFRVNFSENLQPDVFISIHHNSTASADPTINETQTYYPLGREDASLDLARCIHRQLVLKLDIKPAKILAGNFHVLRNATVPAVLGEPAMISNPVIAGRLSLAASHELEAQAYFLGLLDYFSLGSPGWLPAQPDTLYWPSNDPASPLRWTFAPGQGATAPGPDPQSYQLTRDGIPVPLRISPDGYSVWWMLPEAQETPGPSLLELTGRNLSGRSTPPVRTWVLPGRDASFQIQVSREAPDNDEHPHDLIISRLGNGPDQKQFWALVPSDDTDPLDQAQRFLAAESEQHETTPIILDPPEPGWSWRLLSLADTPLDVVSQIPPGGWHDRLFTQRWPEVFPPMGPAFQVRSDSPVWIQARGVLPLVDPAPARGDTCRTVAGRARHWQGELLVPSLFGKIIVLDPAGGGTITDGTGPMGLRGADLNLETAQATRRLLEGAGARVYLTRDGEVSPTAQAKVRLAGEVEADLFLTIGRSTDAGAMVFSHHPGSVIGQKGAEAISHHAAALPAWAPAFYTTVQESYAYLLRHTACPAIEARLPGLESSQLEILASDPFWSAAEARALLLGCAAALGQQEILSRPLDVFSILGELASQGALVKLDRVLVDGNFSFTLPGSGPGNVATGTVASGTVATGADSLSFQGQDPVAGWVDPGLPNLVSRHTLELHQGSSWQLWLLDLSRSDSRFSLLMEGP